MRSAFPNKNNSFFNNEQRNDSRFNMDLGFIKDKEDKYYIINILSVVYKLQYFMCLCSELELEWGHISRDLCQHYLV